MPRRKPRPLSRPPARSYFQPARSWTAGSSITGSELPASSSSPRLNVDLDSLPQHSYRWMNAPEVEKAAEDLLHTRLEHFRPTMIKPSQKWLDEDYLIIDVQSAKHGDGRPAMATELLQSCGDQITRVVRGELVSLSASEREEVVRAALSYYPNDLVVVGWAAALVYDKPDATSAVIDLLEYANTQFLEFRYYDEVLTNLLSNVYSSLEGHESLRSRWRLPRRAGRLNRPAPRHHGPGRENRIRREIHQRHLLRPRVPRELRQESASTITRRWWRKN